LDYERSLEKRQLELDIQYELLRWKTSTLPIASVILQMLGFGKEIPEAIMLGLDPSVLITPGLDDQSYRVKITKVWIDSIRNTCDQPTINMRGQYYPLQQALERLKRLASETIEKGSRFDWLSKSEADVKEDLRTQLLGASRSSSSSSRIAAGESLSDSEALDGAESPDDALEDIL
jgi:hypothetical protein